MASEERDATATALSLVAAGLLGFVAGVAVGILFAPKSGEEMRGQIKDTAVALKDKAAEKAGLVATRAKELAAEIKARTPGLKGDGSQAAEGEPVTEAV
jgi:gas vesicle protein